MWVWVRVRAGRSGFWRVDKACETGKREGVGYGKGRLVGYGNRVGLGDEGVRIRWHSTKISWLYGRIGRGGCYAIARETCRVYCTLVNYTVFEEAA